MGNTIDHNTDAVRVIASKDSWIEGEAIQQLQHVSKFEGIKYSVGLPDLHPGKGAPIGAAFFSVGHIYPFLVGNDIGCGMSLWQLDSKVRKIKIDKWVNRLMNDGIWQFPVGEHHDLSGFEYVDNIGTIGGGNHFAEIQSISSVVDTALFEGLNLDKGRAFLLVHSGSRGLGERILRAHTEVYGAKGLPDTEADFQKYLEEHNQALLWAEINRKVIAERFFQSLRLEGEQVLDIFHNSLTPASLKGMNGFLHRKGAAPSDRGPVVIPGSRGSHSYLVQPLGDGELNGQSLAHGAGRKWKRSECKARLDRKYSVEQLRRTKMGSRVICHDKNLLYEEAPEAYKQIEQVVQDLEEAGLVKVICILKPILTYKTGG